MWHAAPARMKAWILTALCEQLSNASAACFLRRNPRSCLRLRRQVRRLSNSVCIIGCRLRALQGSAQQPPGHHVPGAAGADSDGESDEETIEALQAALGGLDGSLEESS